MTTQESVEEQLRNLRFNIHSWGRAEVKELPNILLHDEEIYECVNGIYEGGFALLVATNFRVLLIDKKPLNFLTVEDLRFDMINQIDYSHRMLGAQISIVTGPKNLKFRSYNQLRLRKLINHVQHCMAEAKRQQSEQQTGQNKSLEQLNQQLQAYLVAQQKNQEELTKRLEETRANNAISVDKPIPQPTRPSPELADYLFAQSLMRQYEHEHASVRPATDTTADLNTVPIADPTQVLTSTTLQNKLDDNQATDLYNDAMREVFGRSSIQSPVEQASNEPIQPLQAADMKDISPYDVSPLRIAYSKLPVLLRYRRFNRPAFYGRTPTTPLISSPTVATRP